MRFSVLLLALLVGWPAYAVRCPLRNLVVGRSQVEAQAEPFLVETLLKMASDPRMPISVRRAVHEAIARQRTSVGELTQAVRDAYRTPERVEGQFTSELTIDDPTNEFVPGSKTLFGYFAPSELAKMNPRVWVVKEGTTPTAESLVHEFAHVRFDTFLHENFQRLAERGVFPPEFVWKTDYGWTMRLDFHLYLGERYAYEIEAQFARALAQRSWFARQHPIFGDMKRDSDGKIRARAIAHIRGFYKETDREEFRRFDEMSLAEIFRGQGPANREAPR